MPFKPSHRYSKQRGTLDIVYFIHGRSCTVGLLDLINLFVVCVSICTVPEVHPPLPLPIVGNFRADFTGPMLGLGKRPSRKDVPGQVGGGVCSMGTK